MDRGCGACTDPHGQLGRAEAEAEQEGSGGKRQKGFLRCSCTSPWCFWTFLTNSNNWMSCLPPCKSPCLPDAGCNPGRGTTGRERWRWEIRSKPRLFFPSTPHAHGTQCHQLPAGARNTCGPQEDCSGQKGSRLCPERPYPSFSGFQTVLEGHTLMW